MRFRDAALLLLLAAPAACAAATTATPATIGEVFARARPGETIVLAAGSYEPLTLRRRSWSPPVVVDAHAAQMRTVRLEEVSGLTWRGGNFDGGDVERGGFSVGTADHLVVDGVTFRHFTRAGIGMGSVSDVRIVNNTITDSGSDGIDVALSRRVVIDHNRCTDFHPTLGAHPDCIQLWSRPTEPPTADIVISNNEAIGDMQGFTLFNHARPDATGNKVDDGGFDRVTIENNFAKVQSYWGIGAVECRACVIRHNRVETDPATPNPRVRAWIKATGDVTMCDNRARSFPGAPGSGRCRDGQDRDD